MEHHRRLSHQNITQSNNSLDSSIREIWKNSHCDETSSTVSDKKSLLFASNSKGRNYADYKLNCSRDLHGSKGSIKHAESTSPVGLSICQHKSQRFSKTGTSSNHVLMPSNSKTNLLPSSRNETSSKCSPALVKSPINIPPELLHDTDKYEAVEVRFLDPQASPVVPIKCNPFLSALEEQKQEQAIEKHSLFVSKVEKVLVRNLLNTKRELYGNLDSLRASEFAETDQTTGTSSSTDLCPHYNGNPTVRHGGLPYNLSTVKCQHVRDSEVEEVSHDIQKDESSNRRTTEDHYMISDEESLTCESDETEDDEVDGSEESEEENSGQTDNDENLNEDACTEDRSTDDGSAEDDDREDQESEYGTEYEDCGCQEDDYEVDENEESSDDAEDNHKKNLRVVHIHTPRKHHAESDSASDEEAANENNVSCKTITNYIASGCMTPKSKNINIVTENKNSYISSENTNDVAKKRSIGDIKFGGKQDVLIMIDNSLVEVKENDETMLISTNKPKSPMTSNSGQMVSCSTTLSSRSPRTDYHCLGPEIEPSPTDDSKEINFPSVPADMIESYKETAMEILLQRKRAMEQRQPSPPRTNQEPHDMSRTSTKSRASSVSSKVSLRSQQASTCKMPLKNRPPTMASRRGSKSTAPETFVGKQIDIQSQIEKHKNRMKMRQNPSNNYPEPRHFVSANQASSRKTKRIGRSSISLPTYSKSREEFAEPSALSMGYSMDKKLTDLLNLLDEYVSLRGVRKKGDTLRNQPLDRAGQLKRAISQIALLLPTLKNEESSESSSSCVTHISNLHERNSDVSDNVRPFISDSDIDYLKRLLRNRSHINSNLPKSTVRDTTDLQSSSHTSGDSSDTNRVESQLCVKAQGLDIGSKDSHTMPQITQLGQTPMRSSSQLSSKQPPQIPEHTLQSPKEPHLVPRPSDEMHASSTQISTQQVTNPSPKMILPQSQMMTSSLHNSRPSTEITKPPPKIPIPVSQTLTSPQIKQSAPKILNSSPQIALPSSLESNSSHTIPATKPSQVSVPSPVKSLTKVEKASTLMSDPTNKMTETRSTTKKPELIGSSPKATKHSFHIPKSPPRIYARPMTNDPPPRKAKRPSVKSSRSLSPPSRQFQRPSSRISRSSHQLPRRPPLISGVSRVSPGGARVSTGLSRLSLGTSRVPMGSSCVPTSLAHASKVPSRVPTGSSFVSPNPSRMSPGPHRVTPAPPRMETGYSPKSTLVSNLKGCVVHEYKEEFHQMEVHGGDQEPNCDDNPISDVLPEKQIEKSGCDETAYNVELWKNILQSPTAKVAQEMKQFFQEKKEKVSEVLNTLETREAMSVDDIISAYHKMFTETPNDDEVQVENSTESINMIEKEQTASSCVKENKSMHSPQNDTAKQKQVDTSVRSQNNLSDTHKCIRHKTPKKTSNENSIKTRNPMARTLSAELRYNTATLSRMKYNARKQDKPNSIAGNTTKAKPNQGTHTKCNELKSKSENIDSKISENQKCIGQSKTYEENRSDVLNSDSITKNSIDSVCTAEEICQSDAKLKERQIMTTCLNNPLTKSDSSGNDTAGKKVTSVRGYFQNKSIKSNGVRKIPSKKNDIQSSFENKNATKKPRGMSPSSGLRCNNQTSSRIKYNVCKIVKKQPNLIDEKNKAKGIQDKFQEFNVTAAMKNEFHKTVPDIQDKEEKITRLAIEDSIENTIIKLVDSDLESEDFEKPEPVHIQNPLDIQKKDDHPKYEDIRKHDGFHKTEDKNKPEVIPQIINNQSTIEKKESIVSPAIKDKFEKPFKKNNIKSFVNSFREGPISLKRQNTYIFPGSPSSGPKLARSPSPGKTRLNDVAKNKLAAGSEFVRKQTDDKKMKDTKNGISVTREEKDSVYKRTKIVRNNRKPFKPRPKTNSHVQSPKPVKQVSNVIKSSSASFYIKNERVSEPKGKVTSVRMHASESTLISRTPRCKGDSGINSKSIGITPKPDFTRCSLFDNVFGKPNSRASLMGLGDGLMSNDSVFPEENTKIKEIGLPPRPIPLAKSESALLGIAETHEKGRPAQENIDKRNKEFTINGFQGNLKRINTIEKHKEDKCLATNVDQKNELQGKNAFVDLESLCSRSRICGQQIDSKNQYADVICSNEKLHDLKAKTKDDLNQSDKSFHEVSEWSEEPESLNALRKKTVAKTCEMIIRESSSKPEITSSSSVLALNTHDTSDSDRSDDLRRRRESTHSINGKKHSRNILKNSKRVLKDTVDIRNANMTEVEGNQWPQKEIRRDANMDTLANPNTQLINDCFEKTIVELLSPKEEMHTLWRPLVKNNASTDISDVHFPPPIVQTLVDVLHSCQETTTQQTLVNTANQNVGQELHKDQTLKHNCIEVQRDDTSLSHVSTGPNYEMHNKRFFSNNSEETHSPKLTSKSLGDENADYADNTDALLTESFGNIGSKCSVFNDCRLDQCLTPEVSNDGNVPCQEKLTSQLPPNRITNDVAKHPIIESPPIIMENKKQNSIPRNEEALSDNRHNQYEESVFPGRHYKRMNISIDDEIRQTKLQSDEQLTNNFSIKSQEDFTPSFIQSDGSFDVFNYPNIVKHALDRDFENCDSCTISFRSPTSKHEPGDCVNNGLKYNDKENYLKGNNDETIVAQMSPNEMVVSEPKHYTQHKTPCPPERSKSEHRDNSNKHEAISTYSLKWSERIEGLKHRLLSCKIEKSPDLPFNSTVMLKDFDTFEQDHNKGEENEKQHTLKDSEAIIILNQHTPCVTNSSESKLENQEKDINQGSVLNKVSKTTAIISDTTSEVVESKRLFKGYSCHKCNQTCNWGESHSCKEISSETLSSFNTFCEQEENQQNSEKPNSEDQLKLKETKSQTNLEPVKDIDRYDKIEECQQADDNITILKKSLIDLIQETLDTMKGMENVLSEEDLIELRGMLMFEKERKIPENMSCTKGTSNNPVCDKETLTILCQSSLEEKDIQTIDTIKKEECCPQSDLKSPVRRINSVIREGVFVDNKMSPYQSPITLEVTSTSQEKVNSICLTTKGVIKDASLASYRMLSYDDSSPDTVHYLQETPRVDQMKTPDTCLMNKNYIFSLIHNYMVNHDIVAKENSPSLDEKTIEANINKEDKFTSTIFEKGLNYCMLPAEGICKKAHDQQKYISGPIETSSEVQNKNNVIPSCPIWSREDFHPLDIQGTTITYDEEFLSQKAKENLDDFISSFKAKHRFWRSDSPPKKPVLEYSDDSSADYHSDECKEPCGNSIPQSITPYIKGRHKTESISLDSSETCMTIKSSTVVLKPYEIMFSPMKVCKDQSDVETVSSCTSLDNASLILSTSQSKKVNNKEYFKQAKESNQGSSIYDRQSLKQPEHDSSVNMPIKLQASYKKNDSENLLEFNDTSLNVSSVANEAYNQTQGNDKPYGINGHRISRNGNDSSTISFWCNDDATHEIDGDQIDEVFGMYVYSPPKKRPTLTFYNTKPKSSSNKLISFATNTQDSEASTYINEESSRSSANIISDITQYNNIFAEEQNTREGGVASFNVAETNDPQCTSQSIPDLYNDTYGENDDQHRKTNASIIPINNDTCCSLKVGSNKNSEAYFLSQPTPSMFMPIQESKPECPNCKVLDLVLSISTNFKDMLDICKKKILSTQSKKNARRLRRSTRMRFRRNLTSSRKITRPIRTVNAFGRLSSKASQTNIDDLWKNMLNNFTNAVPVDESDSESSSKHTCNSFNKLSDDIIICKTIGSKRLEEELRKDRENRLKSRPEKTVISERWVPVSDNNMMQKDVLGIGKYDFLTPKQEDELNLSNLLLCISKIAYPPSDETKQHIHHRINNNKPNIWPKTKPESKIFGSKISEVNEEKEISSDEDQCVDNAGDNVPLSYSKNSADISPSPELIHLSDSVCNENFIVFNTFTNNDKSNNIPKRQYSVSKKNDNKKSAKKVTYELMNNLHSKNIQGQSNMWSTKAKSSLDRDFVDSTVLSEMSSDFEQDECDLFESADRNIFFIEDVDDYANEYIFPQEIELSDFEEIDIDSFELSSESSSSFTSDFTVSSVNAFKNNIDREYIRNEIGEITESDTGERLDLTLWSNINDTNKHPSRNKKQFNRIEDIIEEVKNANKMSHNHGRVNTAVQAELPATQNQEDNFVNIIQILKQTISEAFEESVDKVLQGITQHTKNISRNVERSEITRIVDRSENSKSKQVTKAISSSEYKEMEGYPESSRNIKTASLLSTSSSKYDKSNSDLLGWSIKPNCISITPNLSTESEISSTHSTNVKSMLLQNILEASETKYLAASNLQHQNITGKMFLSERESVQNDLSRKRDIISVSQTTDSDIYTYTNNKYLKKFDQAHEFYRRRKSHKWFKHKCNISSTKDITRNVNKCEVPLEDDYEKARENQKRNVFMLERVSLRDDSNETSVVKYITQSLDNSSKYSNVEKDCKEYEEKDINSANISGEENKDKNCGVNERIKEPKVRKHNELLSHMKGDNNVALSVLHKCFEDSDMSTSSSMKHELGDLENILSKESKLLWKKLSKLEKNQDICRICKSKYESILSSHKTSLPIPCTESSVVTETNSSSSNNHRIAQSDPKQKQHINHSPTKSSREIGKLKLYKKKKEHVSAESSFLNNNKYGYKRPGCAYSTDYTGNHKEMTSALKTATENKSAITDQNCLVYSQSNKIDSFGKLRTFLYNQMRSRNTRRKHSVARQTHKNSYLQPGRVQTPIKSCPGFQMYSSQPVIVVENSKSENDTRSVCSNSVTDPGVGEDPLERNTEDVSPLFPSTGSQQIMSYGSLGSNNFSKTNSLIGGWLSLESSPIDGEFKKSRLLYSVEKGKSDDSTLSYPHSNIPLSKSPQKESSCINLGKYSNDAGLKPAVGNGGVIESIDTPRNKQNDDRDSTKPLANSEKVPHSCLISVKDIIRRIESVNSETAATSWIRPYSSNITNRKTDLHQTNSFGVGLVEDHLGKPHSLSNMKHSVLGKGNAGGAERGSGCRGEVTQVVQKYLDAPHQVTATGLADYHRGSLNDSTDLQQNVFNQNLSMVTQFSEPSSITNALLAPGYVGVTKSLFPRDIKCVLNTGNQDNHADHIKTVRSDDVNSTSKYSKRSKSLSDIFDETFQNNENENPSRCTRFTDYILLDIKKARSTPCTVMTSDRVLKPSPQKTNAISFKKLKENILNNKHLDRNVQGEFTILERLTNSVYDGKEKKCSEKNGEILRENNESGKRYKRDFDIKRHHSSESINESIELQNTYALDIIGCEWGSQMEPLSTKMSTTKDERCLNLNKTKTLYDMNLWSTSLSQLENDMPEYKTTENSCQFAPDYLLNVHQEPNETCSNQTEIDELTNIGMAAEPSSLANISTMEESFVIDRTNNKRMSKEIYKQKCQTYETRNRNKNIIQNVTTMKNNSSFNILFKTQGKCKMILENKNNDFDQNDDSLQTLQEKTRYNDNVNFLRTVRTMKTAPPESCRDNLQADVPGGLSKQHGYHTDESVGFEITHMCPRGPEKEKSFEPFSLFENEYSEKHDWKRITLSSDMDQTNKDNKSNGHLHVPPSTNPQSSCREHKHKSNPYEYNLDSPAEEESSLANYCSLQRNVRHISIETETISLQNNTCHSRERSQSYQKPYTTVPIQTEVTSKEYPNKKTHGGAFQTNTSEINIRPPSRYLHEDESSRDGTTRRHRQREKQPIILKSIAKKNSKYMQTDHITPSSRRSFNMGGKAAHNYKKKTSEIPKSQASNIVTREGKQSTVHQNISPEIAVDVYTRPIWKQSSGLQKVLKSKQSTLPLRTITISGPIDYSSHHDASTSSFNHANSHDHTKTSKNMTDAPSNVVVQEKNGDWKTAMKNILPFGRRSSGRRK